MAFHPLTYLLLWLATALVLQAVQGGALALLVGLTVLLLLLLRAGKRWLRMLWRLRWLWLSLAAVFAWATPGEVLWEGSGSPTHEGLVEAGLHLLRLWGLLAAVTVVASAVPVPRLLCGLFLLLRPLRHAGLSPERLVARLMLTLTMVENLPDGQHWRSFLTLLQSVPAAGQGQGGDARPPAVDPELEGEAAVLTLEHPHWQWRDSVLLAGGLLLLGLAAGAPAGTLPALLSLLS